MTAKERRNVESVDQQTTCLNTRDAEGWLSFLTEDFVWRSNALKEPLVGIEAARMGLMVVFETLPDVHARTEVTYPSGDVIVGVFHLTGTRTGHRPGSLLPAVSNKPWQIDQVGIHTFDEAGRLKYLWLFINVADLMQQLGALPADLTTYGRPPAAGMANGMPFPSAGTSYPFPGAAPATTGLFADTPPPSDRFTWSAPSPNGTMETTFDALAETLAALVRLPFEIVLKVLQTVAWSWR